MKTILLAACFALFAAAASAQTKSKTADTSKTKPAGVPSPFRMHFSQLFRQNADASWSPVQPLMINGEMVPTSTKLVNGIKYGGLDLMGNQGSDLWVDTLRGVVIVHGFVK
jgi:phosphatidylserine synthase